MRLEQWFVRNFYAVNFAALLLAVGLHLLNVFYGRFSVSFCVLLSIGMAADVLTVIAYRYVPALRAKMQQTTGS